MSFPWSSVLAGALLALPIAACAADRPLNVGVVFQTAWNVRGQTLTASEQALAKEMMFRTLGEAFRDFAVTFSEGDAGDRLIKVEDTPYSRSWYLGAVGVTNPAAVESSVRFDALSYAALLVAGCESLAACGTATRAQLAEGLGRGLGATAAHELGHQRGFGFGRHSRCEDCYDSASSISRAHFFGRKYWSDEAMAAMRRVLPIPARDTTAGSPR